MKQKFAILVVFSLLIITPFFVHARGLVPCGGDGEAACTVTDIFVLIARCTNWLIALAGVYAVYELVFAGFWMILAVGNEENLTKQKARIGNAIIGFIMVLMAYMFVNTAVNVILTNGDCQKLNLSNPLSYLTINPPSSSKCAK